MRIASWGLLLMSAACALNPAPVPVSGLPSDIRALTGNWTGEYHSVETGRSGSIVFALTAGQDTARGDVVMVAREAGMTFDDVMRVTRERQAANQVLTIRFVEVDGATVTGTIDPYPDPEDDCDLLTVFQGELHGNKISGTFRTFHMGRTTPAEHGTWSVTRSK